MTDRIMALAGRVLLALLFVLAGLAKIVGPAPYLEDMVRLGVPTALLPAVIALELGAGAALLVGWQTRWAATALGLFCILTALIFHHDLADKVERTSFIKDLAIAGGLFVLAASTLASRDRKTRVDRPGDGVAPPP